MKAKLLTMEGLSVKLKGSNYFLDTLDTNDNL